MNTGSSSPAWKQNLSPGRDLARNDRVWQVRDPTSVVNAACLRDDFFEILPEVNHHGPATDFAVVVDIAGSLFGGRKRHVEALEAGGAGYRIDFHFLLYVSSPILSRENRLCNGENPLDFRPPLRQVLPMRAGEKKLGSKIGKLIHPTT